MSKTVKKISILLIAIVIVISGVLFAVVNPILLTPDITDKAIPVDTGQLRHDVVTLTQTSSPRSFDHPEALDEAASYIQAVFDSCHLKTKRQVFKVGTQQYGNIIASYGPEHAPRLIIGAHYDVCEHLPGADDNASGVAGLLGLARLFNQLKPTLNHRIDLVAYSLEEPPFFRTESMGSAIHAKHLTEQNIPVIGMISLEMIGYFSDKPGSQRYPIKSMDLLYPDKGDFIAVVGKMGQNSWTRAIKEGMLSGSDLPVESINAPASVTGIDFSDHLSYWKHGFEAAMITNTAFYRNRNYHQNTDTPETLDYWRMAKVIKGIYQVSINMNDF